MRDEKISASRIDILVKSATIDSTPTEKCFGLIIFVHVCSELSEEHKAFLFKG